MLELFIFFYFPQTNHPVKWCDGTKRDRLYFYDVHQSYASCNLERDTGKDREKKGEFFSCWLVALPQLYRAGTVT